MNKPNNDVELIVFNPYNQNHIDYLRKFEEKVYSEGYKGKRVSQIIEDTTIDQKTGQKLSYEEYLEKKEKEPLEENLFLLRHNQFVCSCYVKEDEQGKCDIDVFSPDEIPEDIQLILQGTSEFLDDHGIENTKTTAYWDTPMAEILQGEGFFTDCPSDSQSQEEFQRQNPNYGSKIR